MWVKRDQIEILLDDRCFQTDDAGDKIDIVKLGSKQFNGLIVVDVSFHRFFRVVCSFAYDGHEIAFEVERDDLPFVSLSRTDILHIASGW